MDQNQTSQTPTETVTPAPLNDVSAPTPAPAPTQPMAMPTPAAIPTDAPAANTAVKKPHSNMMLIVGLVLLVVIALTGVAYMSMSKDTTKKSSTAAPTTTATKTPAVTVAKDPKVTSAEIDNSISKLDDTKDYSTTDLNDTTLGL